MNKREEAVLRLENIKPFVGENVKEALDMAIDELKKKPCVDAVSRDELLAHVEDLGITTGVTEGFIYSIPSVQPVSVVSCVKFDEDKLKEIVKEAVSNIEVEYCWHPVSETPKKRGYYLVSAINDIAGKFVFSCYYSDVSNEWSTIEHVEAWMELPTVYNGEVE